MKKLKKLKKYFPIYLKGWAVYIVAMMSATGLCSILQLLGSSDRHVPLIFVLVALVVSLLTEGYFYGILTAVTGVITANYTFTFPYEKIDFTLSGYPLTFFTMLAVSFAVCTLTTRLKLQEKLRRESEKEKIRANLLRAISHDLRTPLTGISGAISAVLEGNASDDEQRRELLQGAKEDAEWLHGMVENLLSITKITDDKVGSKNKREEMLEEVFSSAVEKFKRHNPGITVSASVPEELLFVPMDAVLIQQVIANLMNNAVLHGEKTSVINLRAGVKGHRVTVSVTDNGKGIDPQQMEYLFDGTYKYEKNSDVDKNRSLGIGLSVCRTIVEAHGGEISAYNSPEGGACFEFTLPLEEKTDEY